MEATYQNQQPYFNAGAYNPYYYGAPQYMGARPNANNTVQPKSWTTPEENELLKVNPVGFSIGLTPQETAVAHCNHTSDHPGPDGRNFLLVVKDPDGSGYCTCTRCHERFKLGDFTPEEVDQAVERINDILNTAKVLYTSMDPETGREFFLVGAIIKKIPQLYRIALSDFKKNEGVDSFSTVNPSNPYALYSSLMGGNFQNGMFGQPAYGYAQPQAFGGMNYGYAQQNPQYNPMYGQQPVYGQPAYGYAQPQGGYAPQSQGYAMNPQGAAAPQGQQPVYGYAQPQQGFGMNAPQQAPVNSNMPVQPQTAPVQSAPQSGEIKVDTAMKA